MSKGFNVKGKEIIQKKTLYGSTHRLGEEIKPLDKISKESSKTPTKKEQQLESIDANSLLNKIESWIRIKNNSNARGGLFKEYSKKIEKGMERLSTMDLAGEESKRFLEIQLKFKKKAS